jgi:hypothetical protein
VGDGAAVTGVPKGWPLRARINGWLWQFGLIRYCDRCDGSWNEARALGRRFEPDRWRWHRRHERWANDSTLTTAPFPEGRRRC